MKHTYLTKMYDAPDLRSENQRLQSELAAAREEIERMKKQKDTLRLWMAVGGNITRAANQIAELVLLEDDIGEGSMEDVCAKIEEYICTEMFNNY